MDAENRRYRETRIKQLATGFIRNKNSAEEHQQIRQQIEAEFDERWEDRAQVRLKMLT